MLDKKRKTLIDSVALGQKNIFVIHLYVMYWHQYEWTKDKWTADGWSDITADQLKLINLIAGTETMGSSELARRAGVTKQAMSQMVNMMEKKGVLKVKQDPNDSRAKMISLTSYGNDFLEYFSSYTQQLNDMYSAIIGDDKMRLLTEITSELAGALMAENRGLKAVIKKRKQRETTT